MKVNEYNGNKWLLKGKKEDFFNLFIVLLVSIAFVFTDWTIGIVTLSDYLLGLVLLLLILSRNLSITKAQAIGLIAYIAILLANIYSNYLWNQEFHFNAGIAGLIRTTFYSIVVVGTYNFIKSKQLEGVLLQKSNLIAVIVCAIGVYITIAIYTDGLLPYHFFWYWTRQDLLSYAFNENINWIRARSIFSEPSYLGYYLNIVLGMNYFNQSGIKIKKIYSIIITITILLTFSYSAIGIMLLQQILYFWKEYRTKKFHWHPSILIGAAAMFIFGYIFWDTIYETIVVRSLDIISGEDLSAFFRIFGSWRYVNKEHLFIGNGIGNTPAIWNVYAYILSDLGVVAFSLSIIFTIWILMKNIELGILFIALNFQKGGYLGPSFWLFLLFLFVYVGHKQGKIPKEN